MVKKLTFILLAWVFCLGTALAAKQKFTLVIDAGHGGKDAGACANGAMEKNINLSVALAFGNYVERNCPDVKVVYTRKTDVFIPLHERARIANKNKANLFISVHTNALPGKRPKQISALETYTMGMRRSNEKRTAALRENEVIYIEDNYKQHYAGYNPNSPESMIIFDFFHEDNMVKSVEMAELIQKNVCRSASRINGGVRQDVFLVLRETSMPACLVELGYITTKADASYLTSKRGVDKLGYGLYQALVAYKNKYENGATSTVGTSSRNTYVSQPTTPVSQPTTPVSQPTSPVSQPTQSVSQPKKEPLVVLPDPLSKPKSEVKPVEDTPVEVKPVEANPVEVKPVEAKPVVVPEVKPDTVVTPEVPKAEEQPAVAVVEQTVTPVQQQPTVEPVAQKARPVFKLQILTSSTKLRANDSRLKGRKDAECYKEGNLWKYTIGASEDYQKVQQLRKQLAKTFPQAFVVAFLNGQRININDALQQYNKK